MKPKIARSAAPINGPWGEAARSAVAWIRRLPWLISAKLWSMQRGMLEMHNQK
jgi:hypothetical protein